MQARNSNNAQGIDISHHNGAVDWTKVKGDGIKFAFLKASEGATYRDSTFPGHVKAARAAGILVGPYHFVNAASEGAAKVEAGNFYAAIQSAGGIAAMNLPPVMDYEDNKSGLSKAQINAVAAAFLAEIDRLTSIRPIVYTGNSFAANFTDAIGKYPLWVARYSTQPPTDVAAWSRWDFWQYSDGQSGGYRPAGGRAVAGVSGLPDLNEYAGTVEELKVRFSKSKGDVGNVAERDIEQVSKWAETAWKEMQDNGYFDGTRPGAGITREEAAMVISRMRKNFLTLIAGNKEAIAVLEQRMTAIEKEVK